MCNLTINELHNRKYDKCYFLIVCFKTKINIMKEGDIKKHDAYVFFGTNLQGIRKFLDFVIIDDFNKPSDWYNYFLKFKSKNMESILFANIPNNSLLKNALALVFKDIKIFISCFEPIEFILKYYNYRYNSYLFNMVKNIYLSNTIDEYNNALLLFKEEFYDSKFLIDIIDNYFKSIKHYYDFDFIIRKNVFCFYFYRDYRSLLLSLPKLKPYFNSIDEILELLIPYIEKTETKCYCPKKDWLNLINYLYSFNKDLLINYL